MSPRALIWSPGSSPWGGTWGVLGWGGQKLNFLNMVMWHIKLKGMISRPGNIEKNYPKIKLVTLGWVQIPLDFFESVGICVLVFTGKWGS